MGKFRTGMKPTSAAKLTRKATGFNAFKHHRKGTRTPRKSKIIKDVPIQTKHLDYIVSPNNWFLGKVNVKPSDLVIDTLMSRLTDGQKKFFRKSCFGRFLDMNELAVNPQLIHHVLLREVNQQNEMEMWFRIGDNTLKFGLDEFFLVSGLRCTGDVNRGKYENKYCRLKNEYFNHLTRITNDDIFNVFIAMSNNNNRDVVIMGILFLVTQLMYNTAYDRYVDESLLVLVDSSDMNIYPWGQDIFKLTISSLKQALRNKRTTVEGEGKPTMNYRLNGFVLAFQIWIYEILPVLENKLCSKVTSKRPRILNWTSDVENEVPILNLATDIFGRPNLQAENMVPQVAEALDPLYVGLKQFINLSDRSKIMSGICLHINDDDDFVVPPIARQTYRKNGIEILNNTSDKTTVILSDISEEHAHDAGSHDRKGKQVVYDVDDSDDECEIVDEYCRPLGSHSHPGESSNSEVCVKVGDMGNSVRINDEKPGM